MGVIIEGFYVVLMLVLKRRNICCQYNYEEGRLSHEKENVIKSKVRCEIFKRYKDILKMRLHLSRTTVN